MISAGGASSLDPEKAASKALIEAVQTREWAKFLGRTKKKYNFKSDFSDVRNFEDHVVLYAYGNMLQAIQFLLHNQNEINLNNIQNYATGNWSIDLKKTLEILSTKGLDVIALDLTSPDVAESGYYVVKIFISGLQPLHADHLQRFLGGNRLYEVPRLLGFSKTATTIEQLNNYPHLYP